jgi:hypothetical protein
MGDTLFTTGQVVRSRVTAQGLTEGDRYRIAAVSRYESPFGTFVTYHVQPVECATAAAKQQTFPVGNGHLVLDAVEEVHHG